MHQMPSAYMAVFHQTSLETGAGPELSEMTGTDMATVAQGLKEKKKIIES